MRWSGLVTKVSARHGNDTPEKNDDKATNKKLADTAPSQPSGTVGPDQSNFPTMNVSTAAKAATISKRQYSPSGRSRRVTSRAPKKFPREAEEKNTTKTKVVATAVFPTHKASCRIHTVS